MCKTCVALAAPAGRSSLSCAPCESSSKRREASSKKEEVNTVELPCTIDLISLVEVLGTPRENVAVVTVIDNAQPNSGTTWLEQGDRVNCLQLMFTDTRYGMRQFIDDVRSMHITNHSPNYTILPSHAAVLPTSFTHYCVCGDERCLGSKWRKKQVLIQRRQARRHSSAAAVKEDAAAAAPPNICMLTYRDVPFEKLMFEYGRHDSAFGDAHAAQEQRAEKYSALAERTRHEWGIHDYTKMLPLLPLKDDMDPHLKEGAESDTECDKRINDTYATYPQWYINGDERVNSLKMDHSVESQKHTSLLTLQKYDATALKFLHRKSVHCTPLCYNALRTTIMRLIRVNRSVGTLIEKATLMSERFFGKRANRFVDGLQEDEERKEQLDEYSLSTSSSSTTASYTDSGSDDDDDDDEVSDMARSNMKYGMENGIFALPESNTHPLASLSDDALLAYLENRFARARAACAHTLDCGCLSDDFFDHDVANAFSLRIIPTATTALYAHLGDSIFTADSPAMCEYSALNLYATMRYSDGTYAYIKATQNPDLLLTKNNIYKVVMSGLADEVKRFNFTPAMLSGDRIYEKLMQRQLGGFSVTRTKSGALEMYARNDLHTQPSYSYQAMRDAVLSRRSHPTDKRKKPFGDVQGHRITRSRDDLIALAARYHPDIAHECRGLSDYVYQRRWHTDIDNLSAIEDWLPPYAHALIYNAFNIGAQTSLGFDVWAARARCEKRALLSERDERKLVGEMSLSDNMRVVVARLIAVFCSNLTSMENYTDVMTLAVVIVGVVKFCNDIVERRRQEALLAMIAPVRVCNDEAIARRHEEKEVRRRSIQRLKEKRRKTAEEEAERAVAEAAERARVAVEQAKRVEAEREESELKRQRRAEKARDRTQTHLERRDAEKQAEADEQAAAAMAAAVREALERCQRQEAVEEVRVQAEREEERIDCAALLASKAADMRRRVNAAGEARSAIAAQRQFSPTAPEFKPQFVTTPASPPPPPPPQQPRQSLAQWFLQHTNVDLFSNALMVVVN